MQVPRGRNQCSKLHMATAPCEFACLHEGSASDSTRNVIEIIVLENTEATRSSGPFITKVHARLSLTIVRTAAHGAAIRLRNGIE
jgi:hypothetical protein